MTKTDDKGRVLRESELIAKDLDKRLVLFVYAIKGFEPTKVDITENDRAVINDFTKRLTAYVLEQRAEDFFRGERVGLIQGRKEAGKMFLSAFEAELGIQKPNPGVNNESRMLAAFMGASIDGVDVIEAAERAVAAISKSPEEDHGDSNTRRGGLSYA